jgi:hypothetical protein
MFGTFKSWLGAEPQLGLIVLAVWLPIVGVLAYISLVSAFSAPVLFAFLIAPYAASLLFGPILGRLNERLRIRVEQVAYWAFVACLFAWMVKTLGTDWLPFSLGFAAFGVALVKFSKYRAEKIDYRPR